MPRPDLLLSILEHREAQVAAESRAFAVRVRTLRKARGVTQQHLGDACGLTSRSIARAETGAVQDVQGTTVAALARALGVSADYLLGLTDEATPTPQAPPVVSLDTAAQVLRDACYPEVRERLDTAAAQMGVPLHTLLLAILGHRTSEARPGKPPRAEGTGVDQTSVSGLG